MIIQNLSEELEFVLMMHSQYDDWNYLLKSASERYPIGLMEIQANSHDEALKLALSFDNSYYLMIGYNVAWGKTNIRTISRWTEVYSDLHVTEIVEGPVRRVGYNKLMEEFFIIDGF